MVCGGLSERKVGSCADMSEKTLGLREMGIYLCVTVVTVVDGMT